MRFFLAIMMIFCANYLFAQKPVIDSTAYKAWPSFSIDRPSISNNGKYVFYIIENIPVGSRTLIVQSTNGKWKKEFKELGKYSSRIITDKYFIFINKNDSLGMLKLGTHQIKYIPNVSSCRLLETKDTQYMVYAYKNNKGLLLLRDLMSNKEHSFAHVDIWYPGKDVLVLVKFLQGADQKRSINIADIPTGRTSKIWEGYKPESLILDAKHSQLAFKTGDSVWYCKFDSANAICISDKNSSHIESGFNLGYLDAFSKDGKFVMTSLIGKVETVIPPKGVVEIWSYMDTQLQTEQEGVVIDQKYLAVIDIDSHRLIRLQQQEREWFQFSKSEDDINKVALVENPHVGVPWSAAYKPSNDLVSLYISGNVSPSFRAKLATSLSAERGRECYQSMTKYN